MPGCVPNEFRTRPGSAKQRQRGDDGQRDDDRLEDPLIHVLGEAATGQGRGDETGAAITASDRVVGLTRPAETEKGSLTRLTRKKNQAVVPRKALTG